MNIEKGIRACFPKHQGKGHSASSTSGYNQDKALLDTSKRKGKSLPFLTNRLKKPETLFLKVFLKNLPISNRTSKAQMVKAEKVYEPTLFYNPILADPTSQTIVQNTIEAVDIIYAGSGSYKIDEKSFHFKGNTVGEFKLSVHTSPIYRRCFRTVSFPLIRETRTPLGVSGTLTHLTTWSSGRINVCPLITYGGYHQAGLPLHQICQSFARLSSTQKHSTTLVVKSLNQWKEKGIIPPHGGHLQGRHFLYHDVLRPHDLLSLGGNIEEGDLRINLESEGEIFSYRSVSYVQKDPQSTYFEIIFIPE